MAIPPSKVPYSQPPLTPTTTQRATMNKPTLSSSTPTAPTYAAPTFSWQQSSSGGQQAGEPPAKVGLNMPTFSTMPGQQNRLEYDQAGVATAQNAAFAQAKDQAARTAQAAMRGLTGQLSARGMGGAGYEAGQIGRTVMQGANTIGEASRAQAIQAAELAQRGAELNYQGGISQRGQDISAGSARDSLLGQMALGEYQGGISQRGQDMSQSESRDSMLLQQALAQYQGQMAMRGQDMSAEQHMNSLLAGLSQSEYAGGISQRGQDMDAAQALNALMSNNYNTRYDGNIAQRGQDLSTETARRGQDMDYSLGQGSQNLQQQQMAQQKAYQDALLALRQQPATGGGGYTLNLPPNPAGFR